MNQGLKHSLIGFNGSPNCDKSSADSFFKSWIGRQEKEYRRRRAYDLGVLAPQNRWRVGFHKHNIEYAEENRAEVLAFIRALLS